MSDKVFIKGNKYGIKISIDADCPTAFALAELEKKLSDGRKFFGDSKVSLEIDYDKCDEAMEKRILDIIEKNSDMKVFCVVDESMKVVDPANFGEPIVKEKVVVKEKIVVKREEVPVLVSSDNAIKKDGVEYAKFYNGTLRSGQELKSEHSIVLLGDVNPGAKIISTGNIIVLGAMKGFAHAGATGRKEAAIFAIDLRPNQLRIAEYIAAAPKDYKATAPSIAFVEDEMITIDKIDKGLLKDFVLLK